MRKLLFIFVLFFAVSILFVEISRLPARVVADWLSPYFQPGSGRTAELPANLFTPEQQKQIDDLRRDKQNELAQISPGNLEGYAVGGFKFLDGIVLFTIVLMGAGFIVPPSVMGRIQGILTLIFSILLILAAIIFILKVLATLLLMVGLLLSIPFGTIIYLIRYGSFPKGQTLAVLSLLMLLKLLLSGALIATHQRYVENKGLVLLLLTTILVNLIISFIFGLLPGILASIIDAAAAIIAAIVGIIWAIILLIGAIIAIIMALKPA